MLDEFVETTFRNPMLMSLTLIALALVLAVAERKGVRRTDMDRITLVDAMIVGFAQAIALIPGVSRSGVTITAGLFRGLTRDAAARFSFLLSAPIIAGASATQMFDLVQSGLTPTQMPPLVLGIFTAAVVGYAAIAFLLRYLATNNMYIFVYYRIALGIVIALTIFFGFR
jgi:undecaprenyl-diphosphatase